jgi:glycosyltransferase involved in cell wall biosynthesis
VRILSITAGAASMYCGSCLRDNAVAAALLARGHEVTLVPLYTPLRTDEANVTRPEVLFGGISVYLQQRAAIFRRLPRFVDRLLDAPWLIKAFADRSASTDPKLLGGLTVSMLEGVDGVLRREFDKLIAWTLDEPRPEIVNITNSMLIGLARPLADALGAPVCCTLQGEDLFLDGLAEPFRSRALDLIRRQVRHVDRFVAVSDFEARFMAGYLQIPPDRISVVPLGIDAESFASDHPKASPASFTVGYLARVAPEKGLHLLADAFARLRRRTGTAPVRLEAAGYLAAANRPYLDTVRRSLAQAGLADAFAYRGVVDRAGKAAFLHGLDVLSMPATYDEPKGLPLLEAMACGVPVVQPRRGAFVEILERTGGGLLVAPDDPDALADGLFSLWRDAALRRRLGEQGRAGVREHYTIGRSVDALIAVYEATRTGAGAVDTCSKSPTSPSSTPLRAAR